MTITRRGTGTGKVLLDSAADPAVVTGLTASLSGSLIVCPFSFNGASVNITSATSNVGGTWAVLQSSLSAGNNRAGIAYCLSCPAGVTQVSLSGSAGTPFGVASVDEFTYTGVLSLDTGSSPAGGFRSAVESGTSTTIPLDSGNLSLSAALQAILVFAYGSDDSASGTVTVGGSGTWTSTHNEGNTSLHHAGAGGFQLVSTVGPHNVTGLYDAETAAGAIIIAAFTEVSGPTINTQPQTQVVYEGQTANFSISATASAGALHYQWKDDGSNVGTDSNSYSVTPVRADSGSLITCVVTDDNGSTTSQTVYLIVLGSAKLAWIKA